MIIKIILTLLLIFGVATYISDIGEKREPITVSTAIGSLILNSVLILLIWLIK
jgi:hypothetical protein